MRATKSFSGWAGCSLAVSILLLMGAPKASAQPGGTTDLADQTTQTRIFPEPLVWVGEHAPETAESEALLAILGQLQRELADPIPVKIVTTNAGIITATYKRAPIHYPVLEQFISQHPDSPWTPSLRANLAEWYREQGRYTLALEHWEKAWAATKGLSSNATGVADFTIAHWTSLLASLGRVDTLREIFAEIKGARPAKAPCSSCSTQPARAIR